MRKIIKRKIFNLGLNVIEREVISVSCKRMFSAMTKYVEDGNTLTKNENIAYETLKNLIEITETSYEE